LAKIRILVDEPPSLLQDYPARNLTEILDREASRAAGRNFAHQANSTVASARESKESQEMSSDIRRMNRAVLIGTVAVITLTMVACAGTRGRRKAPEQSGFLRDYSQLTEDKDRPAKLSYVNEDANWSDYDAIWIESISMWANEETDKLEDEDKHMLTGYLFNAVHAELSEHFKIADGPGTGVLQFRAALTEAKGANVPLKAITTIVPQLKLASTLIGSAADIAVTVGEATLEAEVLDSMTKVRLAAAVDQQAGKKWYTQLKTWSDVKVACEYWAEKLREMLVKKGVKEKT
jgi:hypothetical protein